MKTDERFLIVGEKEYNKYNLSEYPNFHKSGSKEGMRNKYYGEDACLIQAGNFIYHVQKEVFDKIKADMEILSFTYMGHEFTPVRQFNEKENLKIIGHNMGQAVPIQENWNWDEFYQKATSIGAREIDIFRVDDKYEVIPTAKGIVVYGENSQKKYLEDQQTVENQELITDKIQNYLQGFINKWGINPDMAEVNVKYHGGEELHCQIALNERTGRMADNEVMFTCSSMDEFMALVNENNGDDFQITDIYGFSSNEGINENQARLHEAIADIAMNMGAKWQANALSDEIQDIDSRDLVDNIVDWAHEFEDSHRNTDWEKEDYISTIDQFSELKWNQYLDDNGVVLQPDEETQVLTEQNLHTLDELNSALEAKFPHGAIIPVPKINMDEVFGFVQYGHFSELQMPLAAIGQPMSQNDEYLKADCRIPVEDLHFLIPNEEVYQNEEYQYLINDLDKQDIYHAASSELMERHPDLLGAEFSIYSSLLAKHLHIEGQPLDTAIAWVLQDPNMTDTEIKQVMNDPGKEKRKLEELKNTPMDRMEKVAGEKAGLPENMGMKRNMDRIYFYEKGVMGFAEVDRMRGVTFKGEPMSRENWSFINDFVLNKNLETRNHLAFFITAGVNAETKAYLDTERERLVTVDVQQDMNGRKLYTINNRILNEEGMRNLQDITGRITDARIYGIDNPVVRCRIDGVQQMGARLTKADIIQMGSRKGDEMKDFALSMAVKHFTAELQKSIGQNKGMKR